MKPLSMLSFFSAGLSAITKDDIVLILSILVMVINAIIEYLGRRKDDKKEKEGSI